MKCLSLIIVLLIAGLPQIYAEKVKSTAKSLGGTDSLAILTKGLPKESHSYSTTLCGLKASKDFHDGYDIAKRLLRHGLKPHYLSYPEFKSTLSGQAKIDSVSLTDYNSSKKLSESVNGFNFAMAMTVFDLKLKALRDNKAKTKK